MAFKQEKLVLLRASVPASGRLWVAFQELVEEVAAGRGQWSHRPCGHRASGPLSGPPDSSDGCCASARIGVDLCPLKLSGLGGLGASLPGVRTLPPASKAPLWLECVVQVGLWGLLRRTSRHPPAHLFGYLKERRQCETLIVAPCA